MSKQAYVGGVQPDPPDGPLFGRNMDPADFAKAQVFAHAHIERLAKDLLIAGSPGPTVSGFDLTLTSGLGLSIAAGAALDLSGYLYELDAASGVNLEAADGSNPRVDLIYASLQRDVPAAFDDRNFAQLRTDAELTAVPPAPPYAPTIFNQATELHTRAVISVHKGTPAGSPAAPAAGAGEVALFQVHVGAGASSISGGDVTDVRRTMRSLAQALVLIDAITGITGDIGEIIDDRVAALLQEGTGIDLAYDDALGRLVISGNAPIGFTPVNRAGDTMTGPLGLPNNGLNVGSGQLQVAGGDVSSSGASKARHLESRGSVLITAEAPDDYALSFGNSLGKYRHAFRSVYNPDGNIGNQIYLTLWQPGDSVDNLGSFLAMRFASNEVQVYPTLHAGAAVLANLSVQGGSLFTGNVSCNADCAITGHLTKGSGSFLIDHPLDPETKNLIHSFVEGPRPDLIYRGSVQLQKGGAVVSIDRESRMTPGTFEALTKNAQGKAWNESYDEDNFDQVRVIKIDGDQVYIKSNNPEASFDAGWMVIAERNDPYMRHSDSTDTAGRFITEVEKPEATESDLKSLEDRFDHQQSTDPKARRERVSRSSETVLELNGKRGYPRHPEAIGRKSPSRTVITKTAPYQLPRPANNQAAPGVAHTASEKSKRASSPTTPPKAKGTPTRPSKATRKRGK